MDAATIMALVFVIGLLGIAVLFVYLVGKW